MENNGTILVVDDEPANIFLLEGLLSELGYQVHTAMSGQEALQVLEKHLPDAILLDVMMPEMSGMEVLEVLQQKDETREIPILMVTAKAGPEDVEEALKKGAQDYIKKPINEIELLARLRTALRIKHQADTLRNMLRSKEEFIRIVAHDLRTPLSTISGFAEMILMNFSGDEPQSEEIKNYLQIIVETTNNISEYFNKLLTWANLGSRGIELSTEEIPVSRLLNTTALMFRKKAEEKHQTIQVNIKNEFVLSADITFMSQVLNNLVGNAVKFTPDGGTVILQAMEEDGKRHIAVRDTGVGMEQVNPEEFFREEFHKSTRGTRGEKGSGVGLRICKMILDAHGFGITFRSEKGKGTEFIISVDGQQ